MPGSAPLPPERSGHAPHDDLAERRRAMDKAVASGVWRTDPPTRERNIGGVRALCFDPPGEKRGVVVHFHGGGFRLGCPEMSGPFAAALAARCGVEVICPAYRLAPEHPFPAGLNDANAVLSALDAGTKPIFLSGDSAGGGLAASLAVLTTKDIAGLILISPWLDLTLTSQAYEYNAATDPMFSRASAAEAAALYLQGASPEHPLVSPLFASVAHFPSTLIAVGAEEVLIEDATDFHKKLQAVGRAARLHVIPAMEHAAVTRSLNLKGAPETLEAIAGFLKLHLQDAR